VDSADELNKSGGAFPTTHRSILVALAAGDTTVRERAMEAVISAYWKPIYKYLRIRWRRSDDDARDLTQQFFTSALEKEFLTKYDATKAKFRTYLRVCADRLAANELEYRNRAKRGGGAELLSLDFDSAESELPREAAVSNENLDDYFNREWLRNVLGSAIDRLKIDYTKRGRAAAFAVFYEYYVDAPAEKYTYNELANRHNVKVTDVTNYLAAGRRDLRKFLIEILESITTTPEELKDEVRYVLGEES